MTWNVSSVICCPSRRYRGNGALQQNRHARRVHCHDIWFLCSPLRSTTTSPNKKSWLPLRWDCCPSNVVNGPTLMAQRSHSPSMRKGELPFSRSIVRFLCLLDISSAHTDTRTGCLD